MDTRMKESKMVFNKVVKKQEELPDTLEITNESKHEAVIEPQQEEPSSSVSAKQPVVEVASDSQSTYKMDI